jgi:FtsP/CotA-like multicopper oxidase with cupredoxin domain
MLTRRQILKGGAALLAGGAVSAAFRNASAAEQAAARTRPPLPAPEGQRYNPVVTPNGGTLPFKLDNGVKVFHLIAEPVEREFAPGMVVKCWGYNGQTPGPTIECVEGDLVRILVTNRLPEHTSIHWHGIFLPNGMDGVAGLTQPHILPGDTFVYEFTLTQNGTSCTTRTPTRWCRWRWACRASSWCTRASRRRRASTATIASCS